MSAVELVGVAKRYADQVALQPLDLTVRDGEFLTLLGPSGCGKTTTLRLIAGFIEPSEGRISIGGEDVTWIPPNRRSIGMVFQDYALFPHMTVADNIAFGLVERGVDKAGIAARVGELLELIRLPELKDRFPSEISGGQAQRVALARAVAHPPRVLLMDEPLGALDLKLREAMQTELRRLQQTLGITTVYVTHDQVEALTMSDRVVVMNKGRLVQLDAAEALYRHPRTRFVADFLGKINLAEGRVRDSSDGLCRLTITGAEILGHGTAPAGATVSVAVRPEHLRLLPADIAAPEHNGLTAQVIERVFVGNLVQVRVEIPDGGVWTVEQGADLPVPEPGTQVWLSWPTACTLVLEE